MSTAKAPRRFAGPESAENWIHKQQCRGGSCEAEVGGDPARWIPLLCRRHRNAMFTADRIMASQMRTNPASEYRP